MGQLKANNKEVVHEDEQDDDPYCMEDMFAKFEQLDASFQKSASIDDLQQAPQKHV